MYVCMCICVSAYWLLCLLCLFLPVTSNQEYLAKKQHFTDLLMIMIFNHNGIQNIIILEGAGENF